MIKEIQIYCHLETKVTYKEISHQFGISEPAAKKYLNMSDNEMKALDNPTKYKTRKTVIDGYKNMIFKMLRDGYDPEIVLAYVIKSGYKNRIGTLASYIERVLYNNFGIKLNQAWYLEKKYPDDVVIIKRTELFKFITSQKSKYKVNETIKENFGIITLHYPLIIEVILIYNDFHKVIMGNDPNLLDDFIKKNTSPNSIISTFVNGIKKDITPVKNAISYSESSGFVEGNNNKFKLIKRILYGRSNLVNLFKKSYLAFAIHKNNFDLSELLKTSHVKT